MRVNRRWLDAPEGGALFVGPDRLGQLVADVALGGMPSGTGSRSSGEDTGEHPARNWRHHLA